MDIETMSEKHTKGPWAATRSDPAEGADVWWITGGDGNNERDIATVPGGITNERNAFNAALIATAPDLLEFARLCANDIDGCVSPGMKAKARDAIAKATTPTPP